MDGTTNIHLTGMTWNHERGISPLIEASRAYNEVHPHIQLSWDNRPLQAFESQPIRELAQNYDLVIIDHPHLGEAVNEDLLVDLSACERGVELALIETHSTGPSHISYSLNQGQWALAVDAATAVACYRKDLLTTLPDTWQETIQLAKTGNVVLPLRSPHALMAFFWLAGNQGFSIAATPEQLMADNEIEQVLEQFLELAQLIPADCYQFDPISLYENMACHETTPAYCPHGYGYINYSRANFRPHKLTFTNIAEAGSRGVAGTVLGGTGIAVSALSAHTEAAIDFAYWIASAQCQTGLWVASGGQPGNRAAWIDKHSNTISGEFMKNTLATLEGAWVRPRYRGYLHFQSTASDLICEYLQHSLSLKQCIEKIQTLYRNSYL